MALNVFNQNESIPVNTLRVLYYGQPGAGKSSIGVTHSRPLVLDFDKGSHRSEFATLATRIQVDSWSDILELERATNNFAEYDTIVIDTISKCLDYIMADIIARNPKSSNGRGSLSMPGWGELAVAFKSWIHKVTNLGKDVVMIAQFVEEKDGDNVRKRPKVQGKQALSLILEEADFVGFVYLNENKRTIGFTPTDDYFGKDSARLGVVRMDDFHTNPNYGAELIVSMKSAFARMTEAQVKAIETVTAWRDTINGYTTASEFNAILQQILQMPEGTVKIQVSSVLKARRESLHIGYDKATGLFTDPPAAATAPPPATQPTDAPAQPAPTATPAPSGEATMPPPAVSMPPVTSDPVMPPAAPATPAATTPAPATEAPAPAQTPAPAMNF